MEESREFREALRRELPVWEGDGILTPGAARALAARYDLEDAPAAAPRRDRTGPLAAAAGVGAACTLAAALLGVRDGVLLPLVALAAALAAAPLVARGDAFAPAAAALRAVGRVLFYLAAWALSFVAVADAVRFRIGIESPGLLAAVPAFALAAAAAVMGLRRTDVEPHARGEAMLLAATVVAFAAGLSLDDGNGAAIVANLALAFLAVGRVVRGLSWLARGPFWEGLVVAAVLLSSRLLDVTGAAWLRAVGVAAVIAAAAAFGLAFERRRARTPGPIDAPAA
ncbi:MAG TPA: hypothetical protein VFL83_08605 [Anaeromyxobacter sp.]|nr:hypothetical protein [Anaeromyxobacter sp.]